MEQQIIDALKEARKFINSSYATSRPGSLGQLNAKTALDKIALVLPEEQYSLSQGSYNSDFVYPKRN